MKTIEEIAAETVRRLEPQLDTLIEQGGKSKNHEIQSGTAVLERKREKMTRIVAEALREALASADPENLEGPGRTPEELAENARELDRIAPTPADKFALMLGLPTPWGFQLWQHLHREHGLTLLESQIQEIVRLARQLDEAPEPDPMAGHPELPLDHASPAYAPPRYVHGVCGSNPCTCPEEQP